MTIKKPDLIRYRIIDSHGAYLPGSSIEMPRPGETREECMQRLKNEFGYRIEFIGAQMNESTSA